MIILFFSHVIGDYYFQSKKMAIKKSEKLSMLLLHGLIYSAVFFTFALLFYDGLVVIPIAIICMSHVIIDLIKSGKLGFKFFSKNKFASHLFDQILHFVFLIIIYTIFIQYFEYRNWVTLFLNENDYQEYGLAIIFLIGCVLYLLKPMRLLLDDLLEVSVGNQINSDDNKKSIYLGYLERLITFFSLILGTWIVLSVLVGFKTWAQSERLKNESNDFPKRYLIGTIASIISSIILAGLYIWYLNLNDLTIVTI